jgi:hypothetical protein
MTIKLESFTTVIAPALVTYYLNLKNQDCSVINS